MTRFRTLAGMLTGTALSWAGAGLAAQDPAQSGGASPPTPTTVDSPGVDNSPAASDGVEDIVVTARRITENLQSTPLAITAVTAKTLEQRQITSLEKLSQLAPNVSIGEVSGSIGSINAYIRGIGMSELILTQDPPVGLYLDGVYVGRNNGARLDLVELERVEVLRGPQGTLFGRNTTGGAISLVTRSPSDEFGVQLLGSYGSFDAARGRVRVDTGLLGNSGIKATIAYQHRQMDGFIDNLAQPRDSRDPGAQNIDSVWFKGEGRWGDLTATVSADYSDARGVPGILQIRFAGANVQSYLARSASLGGQAFQLSPERQKNILAAPQGYQHQVTGGASLTLNYEISDAFSIKSITAARKYDFKEGPSQNGTGPIRGLLAATPTAAGIAAAIQGGVIQTVESLFSLAPRQEDQHQFSQEGQLIGKFDAVDFVAGIYYFSESGDAANVGRSLLVLTPTVGFLSVSPVAYDFSGKSLAGFGQVNVRPTLFDDKLELTGGIRYTRDHKEVDQRAATARVGDNVYHNTSYLASLRYQWSRDIMTYARYATGYRSGGYNIRASGATPFVFSPEKARTIEGGIKTEFFDRKVRLNVSGYYTKYNDLQVSQYQSNIAGSGSSTLNANAHFSGFDADLQVVPTRGLVFTGTLGHVSPVFDQLFLPLAATATAPAVLGPQDPAVRAAGLVDASRTGQFNYVPHWTAAAGVSYEFPRFDIGRLTVRADYAYTSKRWYFPSSDLPTVNPFARSVEDGAYGLLGARVILSDIAVGGSRAQITLFGDNLLGTKYTTAGIDFGALNFGGNAFGIGRTLGIEGKIDF